MCRDEDAEDGNINVCHGHGSTPFYLVDSASVFSDDPYDLL